MTKSQVAEMVNRYLTEEQSADGRFGDIRFLADEAGIQNGEGWWRVPVRASRLPERLTPYFDLLAEVEQHIRDREGFDLLLITGEPLDEGGDRPTPLATARNGAA